MRERWRREEQLHDGTAVTQQIFNTRWKQITTAIKIITAPLQDLRNSDTSSPLSAKLHAEFAARRTLSIPTAAARRFRLPSTALRAAVWIGSCVRRATCRKGTSQSTSSEQIQRRREAEAWPGSGCCLWPN